MQNKANLEDWPDGGWEPVVQTNPICAGWGDRTIAKAGGLDAATRRWNQARQTKPISRRGRERTGAGRAKAAVAAEPDRAKQSQFPPEQ